LQVTEFVKLTFSPSLAWHLGDQHSGGLAMGEVLEEVLVAATINNFLHSVVVEQATTSNDMVLHLEQWCRSLLLLLQDIWTTMARLLPEFNHHTTTVVVGVGMSLICPPP
jgi:hypothetical protein